jgi:hypothetical protein
VSRVSLVVQLTTSHQKSISDQSMFGFGNSAREKTYRSFGRFGHGRI